MRHTLITLALCLMPTLAFAGGNEHKMKDWGWERPAYTEMKSATSCCCKGMNMDMSQCCCKNMNMDMSQCCCCKGMSGKQCPPKTEKMGEHKPMKKSHKAHHAGKQAAHEGMNKPVKK